ncbi:MAG: iron-sulfur cluster assembly scaffold protein [Coxiellaceae bacterium]|nr:iron-sulfur cluster assembly scaffold protein [Coxiellaceae bacterium]
MANYSKKTLFYFHRLDHAGFDDELRQQGHYGEAGVMANGDKVQMVLHIKAEQVHRVRYHVYGSVATMACAEYVASQLEGDAVDQINNWTSERVLTELQLPQVKINSAVIVATAVERALKQYLKE